MAAVRAISTQVGGGYLLPAWSDARRASRRPRARRGKRSAAVCRAAGLESLQARRTDGAIPARMLGVQDAWAAEDAHRPCGARSSCSPLSAILGPGRHRWSRDRPGDAGARCVYRQGRTATLPEARRLRPRDQWADAHDRGARPVDG